MAAPTPLGRCFATRDRLGRESPNRICYVCTPRGRRAAPPRHLRPRNHAGNSLAMIRTEYLEALGDLGYSQQESRFLYLAATHSGCFTLRQFLYFTATAKGWNVHQFT